MFLHGRDDASASEGGGFKLYHYDPTIAGSVIFVILFLGTTLFHFWQLFRGRCWFLIPLAIGGTCKLKYITRTIITGLTTLMTVEIIGYAGRAKSGHESPNWTLGPYIIQSILLLVAPALFAATIYMELARIVVMVDGEGHVLIPKKWLTKIFVFGDLFSFVLQGGGKAMLMNSVINYILISTLRWWLPSFGHAGGFGDRGQGNHRRSHRPTHLLWSFHRRRNFIPQIHSKIPDRSFQQWPSMEEAHGCPLYWQHAHHGSVCVQGC